MDFDLFRTKDRERSILQKCLRRVSFEFPFLLLTVDACTMVYI